MAARHHLAAVLLSLVLVAVQVASARSEMAPEGGFLTGSGSTQMPAPKAQYRTRLAWIIASYHDNLEAGGPLANVITRATLPPLARQALDRELGHIAQLPDDHAAAYYRALIRDYDKLELAVFDEGKISRPLKAALIDLMANVLTTLASNRTFNELVDSYSEALRLEQQLQRKSAEELARWVAETTVNSAEFRIEAFLAFLEKQKGAAQAGFPGPRILDPSRLVSLEEYFKWASTRPFGDAEKKAIAEALTKVPAPLTPNQLNLWGIRVLQTALGTLPGPVAGALIGPLGGDLGVAQLRSQAVMCYLQSRCGCASPRGDKLAAPAAWTTFLPEVAQRYQTRLGRLLASSSKWGFTVAMGNTRFQQELDRIKSLRAANPPVEFTAFLVHFIQDIDALQAEFVAEAQQTVGFVESLTLSFLASAGPSSLAAILGSTGGTPVTVASIVLSAGFSSAGEYINFSAERKVIASLQALRTQMIEVLASSNTDCGCNAVMGIAPAGTRKGLRDAAETQR